MKCVCVCEVLAQCLVQHRCSVSILFTSLLVSPLTTLILTLCSTLYSIPAVKCYLLRSALVICYCATNCPKLSSLKRQTFIISKCLWFICVSRIQEASLAGSGSVPPETAAKMSAGAVVTSRLNARRTCSRVTHVAGAML